MKDVHPLRRKSIKPSASTIRGMLPGVQFRALDAAMQSLRSAGLRLEWIWTNKDTGWVCVGMHDDQARCRLVPTSDPLLGQMVLTKAQQKVALKHDEVPEKFKKILKLPVDETREGLVYEFELGETNMRDLFSSFVEAVGVVFDEIEKH